MQHMVNKAHTRWVAAILISGHLAHAGNHRHGSAGHRLTQGDYFRFLRWDIVSARVRSCPSLFSTR